MFMKKKSFFLEDDSIQIRIKFFIITPPKNMQTLLYYQL